MPRYEITGPDGHRYDVTAPDGASEADVLERVKAEAMKATTPQGPPSSLKSAPERTWYRRTRLTAPQYTPTGERIGELPPGAPEPTEYQDPNDVVAPALAALGLAGIAPVAATMGAPWIPATMLPARMATGVQPSVVEPGLAEIASMLSGAGSAVGSGAKSVAENPAVREALKWIARGALGTAGFEGARRLMK